MSAPVTMDINGMEQVNIVALGGADNVTIADLARTGIKQVNVDLSANTRSRQGDAQADTCPSTAPAATTQIQIRAPAFDQRPQGWRRRSASSVPMPAIG